MKIENEAELEEFLQIHDYTKAITPFKELFADFSAIKMNISEMGVKNFDVLSLHKMIFQTNKQEHKYSCDFTFENIRKYYENNAIAEKELYSKVTQIENHLRNNLSLFISEQISLLKHKYSQENWREYLLDVSTYSGKKKILEIFSKMRNNHLYIWFAIHEFSFGELISLLEIIYHLKKIDKKDKKIFLSQVNVESNNYSDGQFFNLLFFTKALRNSIAHLETLQVFYIKERGKRLNQAIEHLKFKKIKIIKLKDIKFLVENNEFCYIPISSNIILKKSGLEVIIEKEIREDIKRLLEFKIKKSS